MNISPDQVLLTEPRWRADDLGLPLPDSPHANSVCLPTWQDVIDYEEKNPRVMERLRAGYPRFVVPSPCQRFFEECRTRFGKPGRSCHAYPTERTARRAADYITRWTGEPVEVTAWGTGRVHMVCFPESAHIAALKYWRHAGEGISSRQAEALIEGRKDQPAVNALLTVTNRIADLAGVPQDCVYLFPSGMTAIFTLYRALMRLKPDGTCVQFGFPYVDTLKIQQQFGHRSTFFPLASPADMKLFTRMSLIDTVAGLMTEFPSNPLLTCPDLRSLSRMGEERGFPVIVDDTISSWVNTDVLPHVDATVTSLTKYFTGRGDLMAGAVILNPKRPLYQSLRSALRAEHEDCLWSENVVLLERYSRDFTERVLRINRTAEQVCDWLLARPEIAAVHYPKFQTPERYDAFRRPDGGYSGLFSIVLKDTSKTPAFYDRLRFNKGPNLGTTFSLCCPFTMLAHYDELDWAEQCGVSRHLVRFSIGLEEPADLIARLEEALIAG